MNRIPPTLIGFVAAVVAALLIAPSPARAQEPQRKTLLMHYMPWYVAPPVRAEWGGHWTGWGKHDPEQLDANGLPDLYSNFHPLIGPYDSTDPAVLECQLLEMKFAGVDGVVADWYGISGTYDYPENHAASEALFEMCAKVGLTFSVCFEDRTVEANIKEGKLTEEQIPQHLGEMFRWLDANWFGAPQYQQWDGRPLFLCFGPVFVDSPETWAQAEAGLEHPPATFGLHHLWQKMGADGGFTWVHWEPFTGEAMSDATSEERVAALDVLYRERGEPDRTIVSAVTGFADVYKPGGAHPNMDHRGGETLAEHLEVVMNGPWQFVQLVTWNDYGEGTMFEPTHEFGYTFLEELQEARRAEAGGEFPYTAEDLRLPAKLLALRRAGVAPRGELNRLSQILIAGDTRRARYLFNAIDTGGAYWQNHDENKQDD